MDLLGWFSDDQRTERYNMMCPMNFHDTYFGKNAKT